MAIISTSKKKIKKKRLFPALHQRLIELDMSQSEIADLIGLTKQTFSAKMNGRVPWRETEMQLLLDEIGTPEETLADLFPRRKVSA